MAEGGGAEQRYGVEEEGSAWSWWSSAAEAQACRHRERGAGEESQRGRPRAGAWRCVSSSLVREVGDEGEKRAEEMGREIEGIGLLALAACASGGLEGDEGYGRGRSQGSERG